MTIKYYSLNGGGLMKAKVPSEFKKELKSDWTSHQEQLKKSGIKTFEDYVKTVYSWNC